MPLDLTKRQEKGSPITIEEFDQNLTDIEVLVNTLEVNQGGQDVDVLATRVSQSEVNIDTNSDNISLNGANIATHDTRITANEGHAHQSSGNPHGVNINEIGLGSVTNDAQMKRAAGDIDTFIDKATPVDADVTIIEDSADSYTKKKLSWASIKSTLKSYFDTLYSAITHAAEHTNGTDDIQSATAGQKGLATATQIAKLDAIEAAADVTDAANVAAAGAVMDSDISPSEGMVRKTGVGAYTAIKSNLSAEVAPTVNDDSGDGYSVGSIWVDVVGGLVYTCVGAAVGAAVWSAGGGGGLSYKIITVGQTTVSGEGYLLNPSADLTLPLPATPEEGDMVGIADAYNKASTYTLTIGRNGSNIEGVAEDLVIDVDGSGFTLVYCDATRGWEIVSEIGNSVAEQIDFSNYVDRGDPTAYDFKVTNFTTDKIWHDLDCSHIVPSNATAIVFKVYAKDTIGSGYFRFRKKGYTGVYGPVVLRCASTTIAAEHQVIVPCDTQQVVEYETADIAFDALNVVVLGWFTEASTHLANTVTTFDYSNYVDRGDPSIYDWSQSTLTMDNAYHDLDCSSVVPSNATAIMFKVYASDNTINTSFIMRKNGNSNAYANGRVRTQVVNQAIDTMLIIPCDSNQVVEYRATEAFTGLQVTILGWFTSSDETAVGSGNVYSPSDLTDNALIRGDGGAKNAQTSSVLVSDNGEMTNPSQPLVSAVITSQQTNATGDGTAKSLTGEIWTEISDQGNNFSNGTFTAPISGQYNIIMHIGLSGILAGHDKVQGVIVTSNGNYTPIYLNAGAIASGGTLVISGSAIANMDENDTAYLKFIVAGSTLVVDITTNSKIFMGLLT